MSEGHYSPRCRGLFKTGLKGLGLIESLGAHETDSGGKSVLYHCLEKGCNRSVEKAKLIGHFRMFHENTFFTVMRLMGSWNLIELEDKNVQLHLDTTEKTKKIFICSCGHEFNSNGALYWHRKDTGHPTIRMFERQQQSIVVEINQ